MEQLNLVATGVPACAIYHLAPLSGYGSLYGTDFSSLYRQCSIGESLLRWVGMNTERILEQSKLINIGLIGNLSYKLYDAFMALGHDSEIIYKNIFLSYYSQSGCERLCQKYIH